MLLVTLTNKAINGLYQRHLVFFAATRPGTSPQSGLNRIRCLMVSVIDGDKPKLCDDIQVRPACRALLAA